MFLLSVTVMGSPIPNLGAGEEKISSICNCNEFILKPLSFLWVNAKTVYGDGTGVAVIGSMFLCPHPDCLLSLQSQCRGPEPNLGL